MEATPNAFGNSMLLALRARRKTMSHCNVTRIAIYFVKMFLTYCELKSAVFWHPTFVTVMRYLPLKKRVSPYGEECILLINRAKLRPSIAGHFSRLAKPPHLNANLSTTSSPSFQHRSHLRLNVSLNITTALGRK